ncbi:MAG: S1 RNA-binding domain-containing protein [Anaerolineae bacterium]|jgi:small subunit ribosomal protein S1|nr:S1 RNA-binding domain-containing protein [Anaerolineae bacterium]
MDELNINGIQGGKNHLHTSKMDEGWWSSILGEEANFESDDEFQDHAQDYNFNMENVDWDYVQSLYEKDAVVELTAYGYNRGGLLVDGDQIQGFVPLSHLTKLAGIEDEEERIASLTQYLDSTLPLKVIECNPSQRRIVFSERAAEAGEGQRNNLFSNLEPGVIVDGKITNITNFGVFVDLGGVEGLIHISELSWGRVQDAANHVNINDEIKVKVLQINEKTGRIALSLKQLKPNPWLSVSQKYHIGDHTTAVITSVTHFGAFARLPEGIEGLIHVSSFSKYTSAQNVHESISPGEAVTVKILHIDTDRHRLGLGLVAIE